MQFQMILDTVLTIFFKYYFINSNLTVKGEGGACDNFEKTSPDNNTAYGKFLQRQIFILSIHITNFLIFHQIIMTFFIR